MSNRNDTETHDGQQLPLIDWLLLPALSLFTIVLITVSTESVSRWMFPISQIDLNNCFVIGDPSGTAPAKPNSACSELSAESKFPAEYRFNAQGDREDRNLQAKRPGSFRIVMIGSSFALGLFTPRDLSFAALLPEDLSRQTGRRIELYNESKGGKFRGGPFPIKNSAAKFQEVLSAQPDMILWIITPMDIENSGLAPSTLTPRTDDVDGSGQTPTPKAPEPFLHKLCDSVAQGTLWNKLRYRWEQSRSALVLEHELIEFEGSNRYLESYLNNDSDEEFLKTKPSAEWRNLLDNFEIDAEEFEKQARVAGVPMVAVLLPNRAQAAMISMNSWPPGYDPYRLDRELHARIAGHGETYIDILPAFRNSPRPEQYYMPVDGHLTVKGHAFVARVLAKELAGTRCSCSM